MDEKESDSIKQLATSIEVLSTKITSLISFNQQITKWLIIAICTIAIGKSALDFGSKALEEKINPMFIK